jgi:maleate cis-trans isomerase
MKPERWKIQKNKLFTHQVGFTAPPHDFDAAPSDFLRISPDNVGAHGRMLHVPDYAHELSQRVDNFHLLEEFVHCMSNNGADVCGQVGTNWVHCQGSTPDEIDEICKRIGDKYETPFHMAGYCVVEALREMGAERIALNSVYYWPDWRDGYARFLREAGFDLVWVGNFVDQGFFDTQQEVNDCVWIFDGDLALKSMTRVAEQAPDVDAIVANGMCNFRRADGLPQRFVSVSRALENAIDKPIVASDTALYWRIFKTLGTAPVGEQCRLLASLQQN